MNYFTLDLHNQPERARSELNGTIVNYNLIDDDDGTLECPDPDD